MNIKKKKNNDTGCTYRSYEHSLRVTKSIASRASISVSHDTSRSAIYFGPRRVSFIIAVLFPKYHQARMTRRCTERTESRETSVWRRADTGDRAD